MRLNIALVPTGSGFSGVLVQMDLVINVRNPIKRNDLTLIILAVITSQLNRIDIDSIHNPQGLPAGGDDNHLPLNTEHFYVVSFNLIRVGSILHENHLCLQGALTHCCDTKINSVGKFTARVVNRTTQTPYRTLRVLNADPKNAETIYSGDRLQQALAEFSLAPLRSF